MFTFRCVLFIGLLASVRAARTNIDAYDPEPEGDDTGVFVRMREQLPFLAGDASAKLYYVEAGVQVDESINTEAMDFWHSGIALVVEGGGSEPRREMTLQWYAKDGMFGALLPDESLNWKDEAVTVFSDDIDSAYWTKKTHLGDATGEVLNRYFDFVVEYTRTHRWYNLWRVVADDGAVLKEDHVCDSFSEQSINQFYHLGASMDLSVRPRRNYARVFAQPGTTSLEVVDLRSRDPADAPAQGEVVAWYKRLAEHAVHVKAGNTASLKLAYAQAAAAGNFVFIGHDGETDTYFKVPAKPQFGAADHYSEMSLPR